MQHMSTTSFFPASSIKVLDADSNEYSIPFLIMQSNVYSWYNPEELTPHL